MLFPRTVSRTVRIGHAGSRDLVARSEPLSQVPQQGAAALIVVLSAGAMDEQELPRHASAAQSCFAPEDQSSTRKARKVIQRLGLPAPSSMSKCTFPGWGFSSTHRPSLPRFFF